jgi:hypothetical protein
LPKTVHIHRGGDAGGFRLDNLRPADFPAALRYEGVKRHILRLERRHLIAVLFKNAAQRGDNNALTHRGSGTLYHNGLSFFAHDGLFKSPLIPLS